MQHYGNKRKAKVLTFAYSLALLFGSRSAGPPNATRCPACGSRHRPRGIKQRCQTHRMLPQRAGQGPKAGLPAAEPLLKSVLRQLPARQGRSLRRGWPALLGKRCRELHLELLSAKPLPWAASGCHGQERKALRWRLPRAVLPTTAACQGGRLTSACWAGVSSRDPCFMGTDFAGQQEERTRQPQELR